MDGGWGERLGVVDSLYRDYPLDGGGRGGGALELWRVVKMFSIL